MQEAGYIYKGSYDGWYCVPDETFFTETQVEKADEARRTEGAPSAPIATVLSSASGGELVLHTTSTRISSSPTSA